MSTAVGGRDGGVAIVGAGQHGRVVASVLEAAGVAIVGHFDDDPATWGATLGRVPVLGPLDEIPADAPAIIATGDNAARQRLAQRLDLHWTTAVHPFSSVHPDVELGPGTVVCAGVIVQVGAVVGSHVILNNRAGVGHDASVEDFAHMTVCHLGGESRLGEGAFMGIGSSTVPRVRIGAWATVGAGSVVFADVRPGATVLGNPAREIPSRADST